MLYFDIKELLNILLFLYIYGIHLVIANMQVRSQKGSHVMNSYFILPMRISIVSSLKYSAPSVAVMRTVVARRGEMATDRRVCVRCASDLLR